MASVVKYSNTSTGVLCFYWSAYGLAAAAFLMIIFSVVHHMTERSMWRVFDTGWELIDTVYAVGFLLSGPYLLYARHVAMNVWLCVGALLCGVLFVYYQSAQARSQQRELVYVTWHVLWYIGSAVLIMAVYVSTIH